MQVVRCKNPSAKFNLFLQTIIILFFFFSFQSYCAGDFEKEEIIWEKDTTAEYETYCLQLEIMEPHQQENFIDTQENTPSVTDSLDTIKHFASLIYPLQHSFLVKTAVLPLRKHRIRTANNGYSINTLPGEDLCSANEDDLIMTLTIEAVDSERNSLYHINDSYVYGAGKLTWDTFPQRKGNTKKQPVSAFSPRCLCRISAMLRAFYTENLNGQPLIGATATKRFTFHKEIPDAQLKSQNTLHYFNNSRSVNYKILDEGSLIVCEERAGTGAPAGRYVSNSRRLD